MNTDIQARAFSLTEPIVNEVEKRIIEPLALRHGRICNVTVRLGDTNSPRGGEDKYCRITVEIPGVKNVYIENVDSDLYLAICRAAEKMKRAVSRRMSRVREQPIRYVNRQEIEYDTSSSAI